MKRLEMFRSRYRPSRPQAIFGALVGIGMLYFGITQVGGGDGGFLVFWCVVVGGIVVMNLWSAFAPRRGGSDDDRADDDGPTRIRLGGPRGRRRR